MLDPACGTGNFLYVALELIKGLEAEVLDAYAEMRGETGAEEFAELTVRGVDPRQFLGLELNPRAASIAELVLWIGYLQASFRRGGYEARTPVLEDFGNVTRMDAVLAHKGAVRGHGGAAYPDPSIPAWPAAEFIVGNPPFLGGKDIRSELGDAYAQALWAAHSKMNPSADFVMYWWDHAAALLTRKGSPLRRFGLVTTNSITQTFSRRTVARRMAGPPPVSLAYAVQDHPWRAAVKDAAMVRISMTVAQTGAAPGALHEVVRETAVDTDAPVIETRVTLGRINADLTVGADVTQAKPLLANAGVCSPGMKLHGSGFIVTRAEAERLGLVTRAEADALAAGATPLPRPPGQGVLRPGLEAHIRPYLNGRDLTQRSRGKLVIDLYGLRSEAVRDRFPEVYEHLLSTVKAARAAVVKTSATKDAEEYLKNWWVFGKPRSELRPALAGLERFIATIETSKQRTFSFVDGAVTPDNKLAVVASADAGVLAVLSSDLHVMWAIRAGGWLGFGNDPVYVKTAVFDPFPFCASSPALQTAGEALDRFRKARLAEHPALTLTELYNALETHRGRAAAAAASLPLPEWTTRAAQAAQAGAVGVLAELHDEIDRLTLAAYGWSDLGAAPPRAALDLGGDPAARRQAWEEAALGRLVALNLQRRDEEAAGEVRWLRPAYQIPRFGAQGAAGVVGGDLLGAAEVDAAARAPWPKDGRARVLAIKGVLAEAPGPTGVQDVAARFKGRLVHESVACLLQALQRDGQVRRTGEGYVLPRAA